MKGNEALSNRHADLADRADAAWSQHKGARSEAIAEYLEMGRLLLEAKAGAHHGEFGAVLERARDDAAAAAILAVAAGVRQPARKPRWWRYRGAA